MIFSTFSQTLVGYFDTGTSLVVLLGNTKTVHSIEKKNFSQNLHTLVTICLLICYTEIHPIEYARAFYSFVPLIILPGVSTRCV